MNYQSLEQLLRICLSSNRRSLRLGTTLAKILAFGKSSGKSVEMELGPTQAIKKLLEEVGFSIDDVVPYETDEAFVAEVELIQEHLGLDSEKLNVNGGAIALSHPIGASSAMMLVTLLHSLLRLSMSMGVAAVCIGGGRGIAIAIELVVLGTLAII